MENINTKIDTLQQETITNNDSLDLFNDDEYFNF